MIAISKAASAEIKRLSGKAKQPYSLLRLGVQPGGCSEMSYTMEFDQSLQPDDRIYDCNGLQVAIAPRDLKYIEGLTIDYSEDLMGGGFRFHNPNATKTCGCSNSFSTSD
ncbi:MAG TPA: iron-sulfur cluster assembly accessory protein [Leptolyngbyaceae cyanobacterium]